MGKKQEKQIKTQAEEIIEAAARKAAEENKKRLEKKARVKHISVSEQQAYPLPKRKQEEVE